MADILNTNPSRYKTYKAVIKCYHTLANEHQWKNEDSSIWPISKASLIKFIKSISNKVTPSIITSYLLALKFYHTRNAFDWTTVQFDPLVRELLKTIQTNHRHEPIKQKMHITRSHLNQIKGTLDLRESDDMLFCAVALTAFYGLARISELLTDYKPDGDKVPTLKAIKFKKANSATYATI